MIFYIVKSVTNEEITEVINQREILKFLFFLISYENFRDIDLLTLKAIVYIAKKEEKIF